MAIAFSACFPTSAFACAPPSTEPSRFTAEQSARASVREASVIMDAEVVAIVRPNTINGYTRLKPMRIFKGPHRPFFNVNVLSACAPDLVPGVRYRVLLMGGPPIYRVLNEMNLPSGVNPYRFLRELDRFLGHRRPPGIEIPGIVLPPEPKKRR